ncbi:MAG: hypothetical protein IPL38_05415 [Rhodobacter sp.]|nr:hypothetical protein [Rhodobacter sp.]MBK8438960.1 hypothetical protein [Rhodobacter sp.]
MRGQFPGTQAGRFDAFHGRRYHPFVAFCLAFQPFGQGAIATADVGQRLFGLLGQLCQTGKVPSTQGGMGFI